MWKIHWCHKCIRHVWNKHWCRHVWKNTDVINVAVISEKHRLEILTWFVVYECIVISYRSSLHFVLVQWFLEYFRHDTHLWHQHIFDMTLAFVYFTWHLYLWQQCFSDITATFMTPVFFRNNSRKKWWQLITRPKIIGPKQNVNVICIIHSHTKYQVNISKHSKKKWWQLFYFGIRNWVTLYVPATCVRSYC
jgi:hypothetical protein